MADNAPETAAKVEDKPNVLDETETPGEGEDDEWKADKYRKKVVERIQDEITKTESQVPKSATDLEEFVFNKAKSRKNYLDLVARLLIYVSDFNKKKEGKDGSQEGGKDSEEKTEEEAQS